MDFLSDQRNGTMMKLTQDLIKDFLSCKYKAYLRLVGNQSTDDGDGQIFGDNARSKYDGPRKHHLTSLSDAKCCALTPTLLAQGASFVPTTLYESESVAIRFDGLMRADGPSSLGDFHYLPIVYDTDRQRHGVQKPLLEMFSLLLADVQGRMPEKAIVRHNGTKDSVVRLSRGLRQGERGLHALKEMQKTGNYSPPSFVGHLSGRE
jgi:hypothetical protein